MKQWLALTMLLWAAPVPAIEGNLKKSTLGQAQ
jgi:hypothetical protein